jgi:hypothetical protein
MIGGALPLTTSSFYMSTIVLKSLDYARGTLDIYGPGPENRKARLALEASLAKMGRMALGVSATASRPGVLAELGWLSDAVRGARECLLFLNQLWTMPVGSLAHNCAHQGHAKLLTSYCAGVLQAAGLPALLLQGSRHSVKRAIKTSLPDLARREWRQKMQADPQATLYARYRHTLRPPHLPRPHHPDQSQTQRPKDRPQQAWVGQKVRHVWNVQQTRPRGSRV